MSEHAVVLRAVWRYVAASPVRARVAVVLALCALTSLLFFTDIRWATVRPSIVPGFASGAWSASGQGVSLLRADPSVAMLEPLPGRPSSYLSLRLLRPFPDAYVRVSVEAKAENLRVGPEPWQQVRLILYNFDAAGRHLAQLPHMVAEIDGPADWRRYSIVTPMTAEVASHRLTAFNGGDGGTLMLRNLSVDAVQERGFFVPLRRALVVLWACGLAWTLYPLFRRPPAGTVLRVGLAACVMIAVAGLTPQPQWSRTVGAVLGTAGEAVTAVDGLLHDARDAAARVGDGTVQPDRVAPARPHAAPTGADAWIPVPDGRAIREDLDGGVFYMWPPKLGTGPVAHFFGFAVAGLLLTIGLRSQPRVHVLWYLFLVALSTECLQAFYFTREAELDDLVMNSAGIAVGVTTASVVLALARARRSVAPRLTMG